jgi:hypothetical protein
MKLVFAVTTGLFAFFVMVISAFILYGRAIPAPIWSAFFPADCPQPCWAGVRPGVTTVGEAHRIFTEQYNLRANPRSYTTRDSAVNPEQNQPFRFTVSRLRGEPDSKVILNFEVQIRSGETIPSAPMTVGDLINQLGAPTYVSVSNVYTGGSLNFYRSAVTACSTRNTFECNRFVLNFAHRGITAETYLSEGRALRPDLLVSSLTFTPVDPSIRRVIGRSGAEWRGFGTIDEYGVRVR